jgi:Holliday junction resolvase
VTPTKQEQYIAANLRAIFHRGGRQPGSGNNPVAPNDVAIPGYLHVEAKQTAAAEISLRWDWIERARKLAIQFAVPSVLAIRFKVADPKHDYFVIRDDMFYDLLDNTERLNKIKDTYLRPVVE